MNRPGAAPAVEPDFLDLVHARYEICPPGRGHEQMGPVG
jgi:hypothetical protein